MERQAVADLEAKVRAARPQFDVVGVEFSAGDAAESADVVIPAIDRLAPGSVFPAVAVTCCAVLGTPTVRALLSRPSGNGRCEGPERLPAPFAGALHGRIVLAAGSSALQRTVLALTARSSRWSYSEHGIAGFAHLLRRLALTSGQAAFRTVLSVAASLTPGRDTEYLGTAGACQVDGSIGSTGVAQLRAVSAFAVRGARDRYPELGATGGAGNRGTITTHRKSPLAVPRPRTFAASRGLCVALIIAHSGVAYAGN